MNNRKVNIILGLIATMIAAVSIFVLFATAFGPSDIASHPSTLGSCFDVMFGKQGFASVPMLITAFVLQIVAAVFILFGAIMPGKIGMFGYAVGAIALVVAGIFWINAPGFFSSVNSIDAVAEKVVLGTGSILAVVFSFLAGVLALYGAYRSFKV